MEMKKEHQTPLKLELDSAWSDQSSPCAQWVYEDPSFFHAHNGDLGSDWADAQADLSLRWAKTPTSLCIRPVWSESSPCAKWVDEDTSFFHAHNEDSDQTGRMPRLIRVFAGRTYYFVGFVVGRLI